MECIVSLEVSSKCLSLDVEADLLQVRNVIVRSSGHPQIIATITDLRSSQEIIPYTMGDII